jgi:AraC family transcriptional regulator
MPQISQPVASSAEWEVGTVLCSDGPHDPRFEERHARVCLAIVLGGTFQYRAAHGAALLTPGAVLLGNAGQNFECGHDHGTGDRCLCFTMSPAFLEAIVSGVPGAKKSRFAVPKLPPSHRLAPLVAGAAAAAKMRDAPALEAALVELAALAVATGADAASERRVHPREERAIAGAVRFIAARACDPAADALALGALSRAAAMSPYRFLRLFRRLVGTTPHQYLLQRRLHRAAFLLRTGDEEISRIAFDAGFGDLSTFNRRFRRIMGTHPADYRRGRVNGPV